MNQGKLEPIKQEMEQLNISVLCFSEVKQTGLDIFNQTSTKCSTLERQIQKKWIGSDIEAVRSYNTRSD